MNGMMGPTDILMAFQNFFITGQTHLQRPAMALLATMSLIAITWSMLILSLDGDGVLKELVRKVIFIGFFIWFVRSWSWLIQVVITGFIWAGTTAGGSGNVDVMKDPSAIMEAGFTTLRTIIQSLAHSSPTALTDFFSNLLMFALIIICYAIIAIQIFLVQIEFGIIATLGLILIPFGVLKPMAFISERVFGAIISFGVKMMVLSFITSIIMPILLKLTLPDEPTLFVSTNLLVVVAMLAFLAWHGPSVAASLLSGSPNLSAQHVGAGVMSTVQTAVTATRTAGASLAARKLAGNKGGGGGKNG